MHSTVKGRLSRFYYRQRGYVFSYWDLLRCLKVTVAVYEDVMICPLNVNIVTHMVL